jgi:hypothetical protein
MDFFSGTQPAIVSEKTINKISKPIDPIKQITIVSWSDNLSGFYENYIKPNMFPLIIFILVGIFLFIKYVMKYDKDEKKKETFASFNPNKRLNKQKNFAYYVGNDVPVNINKKLTSKNEIDPYIEDTYPEEDYNENENDYDNYDNENNYNEMDQYQSKKGYIPTTVDVMREGIQTVSNKEAIDDLAKIMFGNN